MTTADDTVPPVVIGLPPADAPTTAVVGPNGNGKHEKPTPEKKSLPLRETCTLEAKKWLEKNTSIAGSASPALFVGLPRITMIYRALGRQLTLDEVQLLVMADGSDTVCHIRQVRFQPVKYVMYVPENLPERIAGGEKLSDITWRYGGQYHVLRNSGKIIALSGCIYQLKLISVGNGDSDERTYVWSIDHGSPLLKMKSLTKEWPMSLDECNKVLAYKEQKDKESKALQHLADSVWTRGRRQKPLGSMGDAFDAAGR